MPRKPRLHVPGGVYHVFLRGNGRRAIFFDAEDRSRWETLLEAGLRRYGHRVHAYCWMTNHIHMAVQCRTEPVSSLMRFVASRYSRETNRKMQRSGHLFERRHGLILVQADRYLKALVRYIHQNPLDAGLVEDLAAYRWSSHLAYLGQGKPDWLTLDWVLSMFGPSELVARRRYRRFISQSGESQSLQHFRQGIESGDRVLGDDRFCEAAVNESDKRRAVQSLDEILERICATHDISEREIVSRSRVRRNARIRAMIALEAVETGSATLAEVARRFGRSESVLSRSMARLRAE